VKSPAGGAASLSLLRRPGSASAACPHAARSRHGLTTNSLRRLGEPAFIQAPTPNGKHPCQHSWTSNTCTPLLSGSAWRVDAAARRFFSLPAAGTAVSHTATEKLSKTSRRYRLLLHQRPHPEPLLTPVWALVAVAAHKIVPLTRCRRRSRPCDCPRGGRPGGRRGRLLLGQGLDHEIPSCGASIPSTSHPTRCISCQRPATTRSTMSYQALRFDPDLTPRPGHPAHTRRRRGLRAMVIATICGAHDPRHLRGASAQLEGIISTPAFHHWHHSCRQRNPQLRRHAACMDGFRAIPPAQGIPAAYGIDAKIPASLAATRYRSIPPDPVLRETPAGAPPPGIDVAQIHQHPSTHCAATPRRQCAELVPFRTSTSASAP